MKTSRTLAFVAPVFVACSLIIPGNPASASTEAVPQAFYVGPDVAGVVHVDIDPELPNTIDPCWYIAQNLYDDALNGRKVYAQFILVFTSGGETMTRTAIVSVKDCVKADHDHELGGDFIVFSDKLEVDVQPDRDAPVQAFVQIFTQDDAPTSASE